MGESGSQQQSLYNIKVGAIPSRGGCGIVRVAEPLLWLMGHDLLRGEISSNSLKLTDVRRPKLPNDVWPVSEFDVLYFHNFWATDLEQIVDLAHKHDTKVIMDMDDDIMSVSKTDPAYMMYGTDGTAIKRMHQQYALTDTPLPLELRGMTAEQIADEATKRKNRLLHNIKAVDLVTVSTTPLVDTYSRLNEVELLENLVDAERWEEVQSIEHDDIWVGWAGGAGHVENLREVASALVSMSRFEDFKLVLIGPTSMFYVVFDEYVDDVDSFMFDNVILKPWLAYEDFMRWVKSFDITLSPLANTAFNKSRSDLRLLQSGVNGIPAITSPVAQYGEFAEQAEVPTAASPSKWIKYLKALILNEDYRRSLGSDMKEYVLKNRTYFQKGAIRARILANLCG